MVNSTPGLDRLTAEVKEAYQSRWARNSRKSRTLKWFLRFGGRRADAAIREVHIAFRKSLRPDVTYREREDYILQEAKKKVSLNPKRLVGLTSLVEVITDWLELEVQDHLDKYSDIEIALILMELYRMGEKEFGAQNKFGYNAEDGLPDVGETPQAYLQYMIRDAVVARLMKTCGRELFLAWAR